MNLFLWLDGDSNRFWTVFGLAYGLVVFMAVLSWRRDNKLPGWLRSPAVFSLLLLLVMLAFRWPVLLYNQRLNDPDEGQIMAGALTFLQQPEFWLRIDGTTHGPFVQLPLSAVFGVGFPADYTTARLVALLLVWGTVVFTWRTLAAICGEGLSRLLILPLLTTAAVTDFPGFVQYSSEHAPMLLLAFAIWAFVTSQQPRYKHPRARLFAAGLVSAMVPFAKLQAAPVAAFLGCWVALAPIVERRSPLRQHLQFTWGWFGAGAMTLLGIMAVYLTIIGAWNDFAASYIVDNLTYASARHFPWSYSFRVFVEMSSVAGGFDRFLYPSLSVIGFGVLSIDWRESATRRNVGLAAGLLFATWYAVVAPGRPHHHYLQLLIAPVGLLFGIAVGFTIDRIRQLEMDRRLRFETLIVFLIAMLALPLGLQWHVRVQGYGYLGQFTKTGGRMQVPAFSAEVQRYVDPGETMAMWGWMPWYYAELGLTQATREPHTERQIQEWSDRSKFRRRFLADLQESHPPIFIDAVGQGNFAFDNRSTQGHETFPPLGDYISANYQMIADSDGSRVYVRNDRIEDRQVE